jgi:hypothetical protein
MKVSVAELLILVGENAQRGPGVTPAAEAGTPVKPSHNGHASGPLSNGQTSGGGTRHRETAGESSLT